MRTVRYLSVLLALCVFGQCSNAQVDESKHLRNIKQLTFGGDNAEAYFSFNGKFLTCQITNPNWEVPCDQIYDIEIEKAVENPLYKPNLISAGKGRTTCSYYLPGDSLILYASTHLGGDSCPPPPDARTDGKYL